jgi:hypothetical protein
MGVADRLEAAAELIEQRGHCQDGHTNEEGQLCMAAAMNLANGVAVDDDHLYPEDAYVVRAIGADRPNDIVTWNDQPGRTAAEVVAAFRAAAKLARGE